MLTVKLRPNVPRPVSRPGAPLLFYISAIAVAWLSVGLPGCKSDQGCDPNEPCVCTGGTDCYLGCTGDGCSQDCHNVGDSCGTVCNDHCTSLCHDTNDCTSSCGNDCGITCHNVASCGAICGDDCRYDCESVATCGVHAGPGSTIVCNSVSTCDAECAGSCHVTCTNVSACNVDCLGGGAPITCPDGSVACGSC